MCLQGVHKALHADGGRLEQQRLHIRLEGGPKPLALTHLTQCRS